MPIIGMTTGVRPGFPELGRLRKGAKKTRPDRPGEDLTYFRFTSDRPEIVEAFQAAYGDQPRQVNVFLPYAKAEAEFDGEEANFSAWREQWNGSGTLLHRCDGQKIIRWYDPAKGKYQGGGKPCPYESGQKERTKKDPGCVQVGRLAVVIPELIEAGFVGYVLAETHSKNDIVSILASLLQIEAECERYGGPMVGVLCRLQRLDEEITTPGWNDEEKKNGQRHKTTKSLLKLSPAPEWVRAVQLEAQNRAMLLPQPSLLVNGEVVDGTTGEVLSAPVEASVQVAVNGGPDWDATSAQEEVAEEIPEEPAPQPQMALDQAMEIISPMGKPFKNMGKNELSAVIDWTIEHPDHTLTPKFKAGAELLIAYLDADAEAREAIE